MTSKVRLIDASSKKGKWPESTGDAFWVEARKDSGATITEHMERLIDVIENLVRGD